MNPDHNAPLEEQLGRAHWEMGEAEKRAFEAERMFKRKREMAVSKIGGAHSRAVSEACVTPEVMQAEDEWIAAQQAYIVARARKDALDVLFQAWRTREASRRQVQGVGG